MDLKSYLRNYDPEADRSPGIAPWFVTNLRELDGLGPEDVPERVVFSLEPVGALDGLLEHAPATCRRARGPFSYYAWELIGKPESPDITRYCDALVAEVKRRERRVGDVEWAEAEFDGHYHYCSIHFWIYMKAQTLRGAAEEAIRISSEIEQTARKKAG